VTLPHDPDIISDSLEGRRGHPIPTTVSRQGVLQHGPLGKVMLRYSVPLRTEQRLDLFSLFTSHFPVRNSNFVFPAPGRSNKLQLSTARPRIENCPLPKVEIGNCHIIWGCNGAYLIHVQYCVHLVHGYTATMIEYVEGSSPTAFPATHGPRGVAVKSNWAPPAKKTIITPLLLRRRQR
jgi:hypothetical protein